MKIIEETEKTYRVFNDRLFAGRLPRLKISLDLKRRCPIRFNPDSMEIVVGSVAGELTAESYFGELLHEMVHVDNKINGIADIHQNYHNKKFKETVLHVGLIVIKTKALGWGVTTTVQPKDEEVIFAAPRAEDVSRRLKAFAEVEISKQAMKELREAVGTVGRHRSGFYTLKYQCKCPPPYNSIRSGRRPHGPHPLNVICLNCKQPFVCVAGQIKKKR